MIITDAIYKPKKTVLIKYKGAGRRCEEEGLRMSKVALMEHVDRYGWVLGSLAGVLCAIGQSDLKSCSVSWLSPNLHFSLIALVSEMVETACHYLSPEGHQSCVCKFWNLLSDEVVDSVAILSEFLWPFIVALSSANHINYTNEIQIIHIKSSILRRQPVSYHELISFPQI